MVGTSTVDIVDSYAGMFVYINMPTFDGFRFDFLFDLLSFFVFPNVARGHLEAF